MAENTKKHKQLFTSVREEVIAATRKPFNCAIFSPAQICKRPRSLLDEQQLQQVLLMLTQMCQTQSEQTVRV